MNIDGYNVMDANLLPGVDIGVYDLVTHGGTLFAERYVRVVTGERGAYIEFEPSMILPILKPKFDRPLPDDCYYEWLVGPDDVKVYDQKRTVAYADYRVGMYYVSPNDLRAWEKP